ncbi:orexin receptor type 2 isoform X2 [Patella vulgata]|uniref:orexin receptor type 2 isoform X2 n=1 Tax=Patella vulgata TaxID=6465 RepID=UPI0021806DE4|nr:orexin receptor type 2 isoform X2 [Patella vulgata]
MELVYKGNQTNSGNKTLNDTLEFNLEAEVSDTRFYEWILICLSVIVFVMGLVGNALVWFSVWRNPRMRSPTNIFLVNLALADFLVILICLPPTVIADYMGMWILGTAMCKVISYLQKVSVFVSVLTLTAISLERWMAICRPLWFRQTSLRSRRIMVVIWIVSLGVAIPDLVAMTTLKAYAPTGKVIICGPWWNKLQEKINILFMFVVFYVIPLLIMTFTYAKVALCLWRSASSKDDIESAAASVPRAQLMLRRKKAKMLIVVVMIFAICYLPVYMLFILKCTGVRITISHDAFKLIVLTAHWLCYFNSAINPAIYNFMSCTFRREFRTACKLCCVKERPLRFSEGAAINTERLVDVIILTDFKYIYTCVDRC